MGPYVLEIQDMEKKIRDLEAEVTRTVGRVREERNDSKEPKRATPVCPRLVSGIWSKTSDG
jgi:hypothetical protein